MTTTSIAPPPSTSRSRVGVQKFGTFVSGMVLPNIAAFIAWGLITALFIPTGWLPLLHITPEWVQQLGGWSTDPAVRFLMRPEVDVLDTALLLGVRTVADQLIVQLCEQISTLSALADAHRATQMVARTLTQHAAPTTFGMKAAAWLDGIVDSCERVRSLVTPVQIGGAVGTRSATWSMFASWGRSLITSGLRNPQKYSRGRRGMDA